MLTLALALAADAAGAQSVVGNWSGSGRSWNSSAMTTLRNSLTAAGHTVTADGGMTAAELAGYDVFVIGEASFNPTVGELAGLQNWVTGGGRLLVFWDSSNDGNPAGNAIVSGIGSSIFVDAVSATNGALQGGIFATEGPPNDIVGWTLATTPGSRVSGGTELAGTMVRYEQLGSGYVFAFGDRVDHDANMFPGNVNDLLFHNLVGAGAPVAIVPEPSSVVLLGTGMLLFGVVGYRRRLQGSK